MKRALCVWFPILASDLARLRLTSGYPHAPRGANADKPLPSRAAPHPTNPPRRAPQTRRTDGDRRATQAPIIVASTRGQRRIVACRCDRAAALGIRTDMPLAEATSLAPAALVRPLNPERNLAALQKLALRAQRFSPIVAIAPPDALLLDIHGCQHLFRGEPNLLRTLTRYFEHLGLRARAAIAPTYALARALAQYAEKPGAIIPARGERAAIEPLPIAALDIDAATLAGLHEVGIERIADVLCVPRAALPARFGDEALRAADRMLGHAPELIQPIRAAPPREAAVMFDGPTTQWEALSLSCRAALADLCASLLAAEAGALRLDLTLPRSDMPPLRLSLPLSRPTRDAARLWSLLRPRLERAHLGFGIEGIRIVAPAVCDMPHAQRAMWRDDPTRYDDAQPGADELAALTDALHSRLGQDRVRRALLTQSHLPERAFEFTPAASPPPQAFQRPAHPVSFFLDSPLPARAATDAGGLPVCIEFQSAHHAIAHAAGPNRIAPEWWTQTPGPPRDYFTAYLTDGRCLWLRHDTDTNRWWIQGGTT